MPANSLHRSQSSSLSRTRRCGRRFTLESLESRTLLSYTFNWTSVNAVTVNETGGTDSFIVVNHGSGLLGYSTDGGSTFSTDWGAVGHNVNASAATTVTINLAGDHSVIQLGDAAFPSAASANLAAFAVHAAAGNTADSVFLDDSRSTAATTYAVSTGTGTITAPGINYSQSGSPAFAGGITLKGSSGGDTYNVASTATGEPVTIDGGSGQDVANVTGSGVASATTLTLNGVSAHNTLNYDAGGKTPIVAPGGLTGQLVIGVPAAGIVIVTAYSTINVTDIAPVVVTPGSAATISGVEGVPLVNQIVGTFTAPILTPLPPAGFPASDFAASITWGDGATSAGTITQDASNPSLYYIAGTHTYVDNGIFTVLNTVTFGGGSYGYTIGGVTVTGTFNAGTAVAGTSATATVIQGALSVSAAPIVGTEGLPIAAGPIATFIDAGGADPIGDYSATIKVTNSAGTVVVGPVAAASITQNGNAAQYTVNAPAFTLPEAGTYQVLVAVTDSAGATPITVPGFSTAVIADAPLSLSGTQPTVTTTEASLFPVPVFAPPAFHGPVASFTSGNPTSSLSDFTATIDWGDGTPLSAGTVSQPVGGGTAFVVSGSHTYADSGVNGGTGTFPIQVYIVDADGSKLTVANTANVADRAIVLTGQLNPASDSGVSHTDAITDVTQPDFFGTTEPLSHVTLYATPLAAGGMATVIGQVQAGGDGSWNITSGTPLADGHYAITATAVDQFGITTTVSPAVITPNLFIDTRGPVITGAFFNRLNGQVDYTIQDPSPASGVLVSTLLDSANYELTKVHANKAYPGKWVVTNVAVAPDPAAANAYDVAVTFNGGAIIRGGYYLFTIRDTSSGNASVQDIAGNHLDGEFYGSFPSGNGINGGDFVAELEAVHNKVFAPQTIVGTANSQNGGVGGRRVAPIHSGISVPVIPVGGSPIFSTPTSPTTPVRGATARKAKVSVVVKARHVAPEFASRASHTQKSALAQSRNPSHPRGPLHKR